MKKLAIALAMIMACAISVPAFAKTKGGVTMPDTVTVAGKKLVLNGMGIREATFMKVDVYVAGLYLENKSKDSTAIVNSDEVKQITLKFVRDVDKGDITKAWREGIKKNSGKYYNDLKPHLDKLNGMMTSFKEGQTLTFTFVPGKGTTVNVNGSDKGTIADVFFGRVLFSVFIARAPNSGLKNGLLGK